MRWLTRILIGLVVLGGLTYLYYTEVKPTVIFDKLNFCFWNNSKYFTHIPWNGYLALDCYTHGTPLN